MCDFKSPYDKNMVSQSLHLYLYPSKSLNFFIWSLIDFNSASSTGKSDTEVMGIWIESSVGAVGNWKETVGGFTGLGVPPKFDAFTNFGDLRIVVP